MLGSKSISYSYSSTPKRTTPVANFVVAGEESDEIECHRDSDGDIIENCRDEVIYKQFIKKLVNDELFTTQLKNHTLVLNDDLTIKVGCETIDKKKALEIADWLIGWEEAIDMTNSPIPTREERQKAFADIIINHLFLP